MRFGSYVYNQAYKENLYVITYFRSIGAPMAGLAWKTEINNALGVG